MNENVQKQIDSLEKILKQSEIIQEVLRCAPKLEMPHWYIGAGCIAQTVWNTLHGFDITKGIKDCDLVYYDSSDISSKAQDGYSQRCNEMMKNLSIPVEIVNEARVHLWYEEEFGSAINPYTSTEDAINEWPTTATAVGVRYDTDGHFVVYAPYGLNDLFDLVIRPNKVRITEDIYVAKVERWTKIWPKLRVIPWDS